MAEQFGDKSQDATPHRRQQAREKGQVAFSQDLGSAIVLLGAALALLLVGTPLIGHVVQLMRHQLGGDPWLSTSPNQTMFQLSQVLWSLAQVALPLLGTLLLIAVLSSLVQTGFLFVPSRLAPDVGRLSPLKGVKRIFSLAGVMRLGFGLVKVVVIFVVAGFVLYARRGELVQVASYPVPVVATFLADILIKTTLWVGVALLILALMDYFWQRWRHEQELKMTPQEVREEMKNLQGDPQIVARRRAIQRQMVLNRIGSALPKADVVVTNPTELSIAIEYDPETMVAPVVVAKGAGVLAQRIRKLALEHNIPIVEKKELARLLYKNVEINHPVPNESYAAVAEVLAYVYQLKGKTLPTPQQAA